MLWLGFLVGVKSEEDPGEVSCPVKVKGKKLVAAGQELKQKERVGLAGQKAVYLHPDEENDI